MKHLQEVIHKPIRDTMKGAATGQVITSIQTATTIRVTSTMEVATTTIIPETITIPEAITIEISGIHGIINQIAHSPIQS